MHVALGHARGGHPHELRAGAHGLHIDAAGVTHGGANTTHQLVDDRRYRTLVGNPALDALGNQFLGTFTGILEITIRGALGLGHGAQ